MSSATSTELQGWQFFVLAALGCATAVTVVVRGQGIVAIALLAILMGTTALVGMAALRTLRPLVGAEDDRTRMIGHRTRVALEREKTLVLRSIKELEFDYAMGKLSDADFAEMSARLRARAARLIRQLDAGESYRPQIERDLQARLAADGGSHAAAAPAAEPSRPVCAACQTPNDPDARFCKGCGQKL